MEINSSARRGNPSGVFYFTDTRIKKTEYPHVVLHVLALRQAEMVLSVVLVTADMVFMQLSSVPF